MGLQGYQVRKYFALNLSGNAFKEMIKFIYSLTIRMQIDKINASLFEINPVLKTSDNQIQ